MQRARTIRQKATAAAGEKRAFTLIEVLVVVAIIALLISILLPSLTRAKEASRRTVCATRLHSMGLAVYTYAQDNKGKIIQCRSRTTQVAIDPRRVDPGNATANTPDYYLVDWQRAAKRYFLDKETWECPNREGTFLYEGTPDLATQGYTAQSLRGQGYRVEQRDDYDQWIIGYMYFGGIREWETGVQTSQYPDGMFPSRSPMDASAPGHWALAADSNLKVDLHWGGGRATAYGKIPPHPDPDGKPAGGNVLTFDGAATWIPRSKMIPIHSWEPTTRQCYWWQSDLGEYGRVRDELGMRPGIRGKD